MKMGNEIKVGAVVYGKAGINTSRRGIDISEGVITKVGRKYFEVKFNSYQNLKFEIKNLHQKTDYTPDYYIYFSKQEILDERELINNIYLIRKEFEYIYSVKDKVSLDQTRKILEILKGE
jgi:hypothetical protein